MSGTLTVEPVLDQLLVQLHEATETTESGIVLKNARDNPVATVIAAGPGRYDSQGRHIPMQMAKGDIVVLDREAAFARGRRNDVSIGGNEWLLVNEGGVIAILRPEKIDDDGVKAVEPSNAPAPPPENAPVIIKPTIGRRVWYWPSNEERVRSDGARDGAAVRHHEDVLWCSDRSQPCDAGIAYVHSDRMVNLTVADQLGVMHSRRSVRLVQEGDLLPGPEAAHAEWMPYQVGQARK